MGAEYANRWVCAPARRNTGGRAGYWPWVCEAWYLLVAACEYRWGCTDSKGPCRLAGWIGFSRIDSNRMYIPIDSPCECEHNYPDSLDARLFPSVVLAVGLTRVL